ncbi:hypothetical protein F66182_10928 [Fusarium sp. NRRL 66182]|nr:hypothetical protein F66182_10928 [Fusarium sp. NRRL 66182]
MSIPSVALVFESGINAIPSNPMEPNSLDALVRHQLEDASRELAATKVELTTPSAEQHQNIISDVGEYLTQTAQMWLALTDRLVEGSHVTLAAEEAHEQSFNKTHMAELRPMATMDLDISKLRKIRDLAEKFSQDVQEAWRRKPEPGGQLSPKPPTIDSSQPAIKSEQATWNQLPRIEDDIGAGAHAGQRVPLASQIPDGIPSPSGNASGSDGSGEDEDEQFNKIDMDALKQRGKGSYYCPLGLRCDKGGVDKDGQLVLFDRNSSFAYACHHNVAGFC